MTGGRNCPENTHICEYTNGTRDDATEKIEGQSWGESSMLSRLNERISALPINTMMVGLFRGISLRTGILGAGRDHGRTALGSAFYTARPSRMSAPTTPRRAGSTLSPTRRDYFGYLKMDPEIGKWRVWSATPKSRFHEAGPFCYGTG